VERKLRPEVIGLARDQSDSGCSVACSLCCRCQAANDAAADCALREPATLIFSVQRKRRGQARRQRQLLGVESDFTPIFRSQMLAFSYRTSACATGRHSTDYTAAAQWAVVPVMWSKRWTSAAAGTIQSSPALQAYITRHAHLLDTVGARA